MNRCVSSLEMAVLFLSNGHCLNFEKVIDCGRKFHLESLIRVICHTKQADKRNEMSTEVKSNQFFNAHVERWDRWM